MKTSPPFQPARVRVWLLLFIAGLTCAIYGALPTMGAGVWPLSGSTVAASVALGCAAYLYVTRDKGDADPQS